MAKTWVLTETTKVKIPKDEYIELNGRPEFIFAGQIQDKYPILSLTIYDYDPMEGIREVWEKWKHKEGSFTALKGLEKDEFILDVIGAIKKAMEGK